MSEKYRVGWLKMVSQLYQHPEKLPGWSRMNLLQVKDSHVHAHAHADVEVEGEVEERSGLHLLHAWAVRVGVEPLDCCPADMTMIADAIDAFWLDFTVTGPMSVKARVSASLPPRGVSRCAKH